MSEYDHYHRCKTLAEFNFYFGDENDYDEIDNDDNYIYCLCSRVIIRDGIKTYYVEKEYASESDVEAIRDSQSQDWDDHSHVHFSLDTSYKTKCERDEGASCYCSASHTDNCCSTDEHDNAQTHGTISHPLQPSDSGADLTYQDYHSDTHDRQERMDQDFSLESYENYLSESTWEKFWAVHGERLIWASWIKKYSNYINPAYLDENNDLVMDGNNVPKQCSVDQIFKETDTVEKADDESMRERKFSYDSKVNPYKKHSTDPNQIGKNEKANETNKDIWLPISRRRSCSEQDRILSPRTIAGTDSMTNVTKLTLSSYDVTSSHVTSESTPTDDYSVSSSPSDDQSNDQTRIANIDDKYEQVPSEELDTEQYWQFLWKKHFGEQYALHYANYLEQYNVQEKELPKINIEVVNDKETTAEEKATDIECENSEGNSQDLPTVIEIQTKVDEIKIDDKPKTKKKNKKSSKKYMSSVGVLLQSLLKEEQSKTETEVVEAGDHHDKVDNNTKTDSTSQSASNITNVNTPNKSSMMSRYHYDDGDGDDDPPELSIKLKRSHELDEEDNSESEDIKNTFQIMGFYIDSDKLPKGELIYRKRLARLRPPRYKRFATGKKTYFDEDGNAYASDQGKDSEDEKQMVTDDDHKEANIGTEPAFIGPEEDTCKRSDTDESKVEEASKVPLPNDLEGTSEMPEMPEIADVEKTDKTDYDTEIQVSQLEVTKRRRKPKRYAKLEDDSCDVSEMPPELRDDPKMRKYWKKRHSLFHRFDEGIQLDRESWFSVTPENVAWHIANKYVYDVVLDAFCGAGGNTIQFARTSKKVIAIDIDPLKIEMARHNATVYGVADRIEFIVGDFFELAPQLKADMVFLSPPWGGPNYSDNFEYDLEKMLEPRPASELMKVARTISSTISLYVPRNSRPDQILSLAKEVGGSVEVEQSFLDRRFVAITAYFY